MCTALLDVLVQILICCLPRYPAKNGSPYWLWCKPHCFNSETWWYKCPGFLDPHARSLRPLTQCNCDCKITAAFMFSGFRRYSLECIHMVLASLSPFNSFFEVFALIQPRVSSMPAARGHDESRTPGQPGMFFHFTWFLTSVFKLILIDILPPEPHPVSAKKCLCL